MVELCPPKPHWNAKYFGEKCQDPTDCAYMDGKRPNLLTSWKKKDEKLASSNQVYNLQEHNDYFGGLCGTVFRTLNPKCRDYTQCSSFTDGKMAFSILDMLFLKPQSQQLQWLKSNMMTQRVGNGILVPKTSNSSVIKL